MLPAILTPDSPGQKLDGEELCHCLSMQVAHAMQMHVQAWKVPETADTSGHAHVAVELSQSGEPLLPLTTERFEPVHVVFAVNRSIGQV